MDLVDFGRYAGGLLVTLGLLALLAWAAKRQGLLARLRGETERSVLTVLETRALDARRRLTLVRCGGREHLLLLGPAGDLLLDSRDAAPQSGAPR